jgi:2'-5' RNA ligase
MSSLSYALVAYVRVGPGEFVENLRNELHPEHAHLGSHVTVLPPRPLQGTEQEAIEMLSTACGQVAPFEIGLGDVECFLPRTPTVFIRVAHAAYKMRELHDLLDVPPLQFRETLPYMPHLTIAKLESDERALEVYQKSRERWKQYSGTRLVRVDQLTFVRGQGFTWSDVAPVPLGGRQLAGTVR